jgi:hypothetical protein
MAYAARGLSVGEVNVDGATTAIVGTPLFYGIAFVTLISQ